MCTYLKVPPHNYWNTFKKLKIIVEQEFKTKAEINKTPINVFTPICCLPIISGSLFIQYRTLKKPFLGLER